MVRKPEIGQYSTGKFIFVFQKSAHLVNTVKTIFVKFAQLTNIKMKLSGIVANTAENITLQMVLRIKNLKMIVNVSSLT